LFGGLTTGTPPPPRWRGASAPKGVEYVTCALTTFGGWGEEFLKRHVRPE